MTATVPVYIRLGQFGEHYVGELELVQGNWNASVVELADLLRDVSEEIERQGLGAHRKEAAS